MAPMLGSESLPSKVRVFTTMAILDEAIQFVAFGGRVIVYTIVLG